MRYDGIIFDVDGVLVEPTDPQVHRDAVRAAFDAFDIGNFDAETVERLVEITGDDRDRLSADSVVQVCDRYGIDPESFWRERERLAADAQFDECRAGRKDRYPDVGVVADLAGGESSLPLAAISNNQAALVPRVLEAHGLLDHFEVVYGRDPTMAGLERRKPDPYYAERSMADLRVDEPLIVGDSAVDVETADRLGLDSAFLRRPHRQRYELEVAPDYEFESLTQLPDVLDR